jgi:eukaryotic-like serine/threonine-protein kinase
LTGEQPFKANVALAVMYQVLSVEPVSPSKLNLEVSATLDAVVAKAMAKRREERFQSAREFAQALEEAAKPRPAPADDMRSMATITDTVFEARDQAPPRTPRKTPSETAPKTASESPLKTPSDKGSVPFIETAGGRGYQFIAPLTSTRPVPRFISPTSATQP